jgi:hypothetical protein
LALNDKFTDEKGIFSYDFDCYRGRTYDISIIAIKNNFKNSDPFKISLSLSNNYSLTESTVKKNYKIYFKSFTKIKLIEKNNYS